MRQLRSTSDVAEFIHDRGPFELCIWDFDGVICDSEPVQAESYRELLARRGIRTKDGFFGAFVGSPEPAIWGRLAADYGLKADVSMLMIERMDVLRSRLLADAPPNWFVRPTLDLLSQSGVRSVVVSSGDLGLIELYLAAWDLAPAIGAVSALRGETRPKADRLAAALASAAGATLVIEDVETYLAQAAQSGAVTVGVTHDLTACPLISCEAVMAASPEPTSAPSGS